LDGFVLLSGVEKTAGRGEVMTATHLVECFVTAGQAIPMYKFNLISKF
jgi:hypothetical protein